MSTPAITVEAGPHERRDCPLEFRLPEPLPAGSWALADVDGTQLALEIGADGLLRSVLPHLPAGQTRTYGIEQAGATVPRVSVEDSGAAVDMSLDGQIVTRYVYADVPARPYFHPLNAPGQVPITRAYPMTPDAPGESRDHPHHRSVWIAHGEVNGTDNWSEETGHGYTRHQQIDHHRSGPVTGSFVSMGLWTGSDGAPILTQGLSVTLWAAGPTARILDFMIRLEASHGDVVFGDTKEGGILSIRVASELDVPRTGRITNVFDGQDESETWGKSAHWCDYSGSIGGTPVGISVFDHPHSFRHPTHWHVRNYGLMTANPFGYSAYTNGVKNGSHILAGGDALLFRYRVLLHRHTCAEARVAGRYLDFIAPPGIRVTA